MVYKLLIAYDVRPNRIEDYRRFVMGEFLPRAQALGLVMTEGWRTAFGAYPDRLLAFAAQDGETFRHAIYSEEWDAIETRLGEFVENYERKVVEAKPNFQFFTPA